MTAFKTASLREMQSRPGYVDCVSPQGTVLYLTPLACLT